jgi:hypothetical protein
MARVIDELVTKFTLKDDYSDKADNIIGKTNSASRAINNFASGVGLGSNRVFMLSRSLFVLQSALQAISILGANLLLFATSIPGIIIGVSLIVAAMIALEAAVFSAAFAFGALQGAIAFLGPSLTQAFFLKVTMPLVKAAAEIDAFERIFSALLQDEGKGKQLVDFARSFGLKSAFEQEPILQAIKTLVAGGQDVNRFLPVLESIGLFAGGKTEDLRQVSDIVKRIIGGQITEAMGPIGLGRFGINKSMLESVGAIFDKKGGFVGGINEAFDVLERLTSSPAFASIRELMEGSINVRLSNALDALTLAMQDAGKAIAIIVIPPIERAAELIRFLAESGFLERVVNTWAKFLGMGGDDSALARTVAMIAALFLELPNLIKLAWMTFQVFVVRMAKAVDNLLEALRNITLLGVPILGPIAIATLDDVGITERMLKGGIEAGNAFASAVTTGIRDTADELLEDFKKFDPTTDLVAPDIPALNEANSAMQDTAENTRKIEQHTRAMLEVQRFAFGGGDIGRLGVTPLERAAINAGAGSGGNADEDINALSTILTRLAKKNYWQGRTITRKTGV